MYKRLGPLDMQTRNKWTVSTCTMWEMMTYIKLTKLVTRVNYRVNKLNKAILAPDNLWAACAEAGKYTRGVGILH